MMEKSENLLNFRFLFFKKLFQVPTWKIFLKVTRYPSPFDIILFSSIFLDMLGKNWFVKIFPQFSKKKFYEKWISSKKRSFIKIVTRLWYFFSESTEYFDKKSFSLKFLFARKFFFRKMGKIFDKTIFFNIS